MITVEDLLKNEEYEYTIEDARGTIKNKFNKDRIYSIPAYQREIRWRNENVEILLNDLIKEKKFLGSILINKDNNSYEIIDGQQRLSVFFLIIESLKKAKATDFSTCKLVNKTYECLFDVLALDFDATRINNHQKHEDYINADILDQRERFMEIWNTINKKITNMLPEERRTLLNHLLTSEVNLILPYTASKSIYVDYYLDLNDKAVKLDNIDILKANLFRINYSLMSDEWAKVQKELKLLRLSGLNNYSQDAFYYHFFVCTINEYLDYELSTIKRDLKFDKDVSIKGNTYLAGTNVLKAIADQSYFEKAITKLKNMICFLKNVYQENDLASYKEKLKKAKCSDPLIKCVFSILSTLIRIDNEVPKMLIMKYFLDVLNSDTIRKENVNCIFDIYVYSVLFALSGGKKESTKLVRIVLAKDWLYKLKKATTELLKNTAGKITLNKKITCNGIITDESGQYLPKHIYAIFDFLNNRDPIKFNIQSLKEYLTSSSTTAEHFFATKSHKIEFIFTKTGEKVSVKIPKKILSYISCPSNFLYIKSKYNQDIGNMPIKDKLDYLNNAYRSDKSVFASKHNYNYFSCINDVFNAIGNYPDLASFKSKNKAKKALKDYYKNTLWHVINDAQEKFKTNYLK